LLKKCIGLRGEADFEVKVVKNTTFGPLLDVQPSFFVTGAIDYAPSQKRAKLDGLVAVSITVADVGCLKRIRKDACRTVGAAQETFSSDMSGSKGVDILGRVAFWSIRSSGSLR